MARFRLALLAAMAFAPVAVPSFTHAGPARPVSCTVQIDYKVNGALRYPYAKDFVVAPGVPFEHDFSSFTRERYLTATARDAGEGRIAVDLGYYNDVGVFEYVDLGASVTVLNDHDETVTGSNSSFTSLGAAGEHTTDYTLTCRRLED